MAVINSPTLPLKRNWQALNAAFEVFHAQLTTQVFSKSGATFAACLRFFEIVFFPL
jgi:hypothetical protein